MRRGSFVLLSDKAWGYLCLAPALLVLSLVALLPILAVIWLSGQRYLPIFAVREFAGLRNYALLLNDDRFWAACRTTLTFTGVSVTAELTLGLLIALLLSRMTGRGEGFGRAVALLPWAVPTVVSARMWGWLYQPEYGLLNYLLVAVGLMSEPINWLGDPVWALRGAIIMDVWKATPFATILLLAGLMAIPRELYWAARVDGAGAWATFRHVTLPLLLPVILVVLVFRTMDAIRVFDAIYVLTGGGPGNGTETLSIYTYKTLFQTLQFGYGSALSCVMFVLIGIMAAGYAILLSRHLKEAA